MDQEKFGKFIKQIRKKNNLTQKQFADKYNVTYQAVSKWENGKNMPDTSLIKQMSKDFDISLEEMFEAKLKIKKNDKTNLLIIVVLFILSLILITLVLIQHKNTHFKFKTLSSNCDKFNISGNIAYNDKKTSIYITNIKYCGEEDKEEYEKVECVLYEVNKDVEKKISAYSYDKDKKITLEEFLQKVTLTVDDYKKTCKEYSENSLYLSINAKDSTDKITSYKIPLSLENTC